jgi:hypothetical protein
MQNQFFITIYHEKTFLLKFPKIFTTKKMKKSIEK